MKYIQTYARTTGNTARTERLAKAGMTDTKGKHRGCNVAAHYYEAPRGSRSGRTQAYGTEPTNRKHRAKCAVSARHLRKSAAVGAAELKRTETTKHKHIISRNTAAAAGELGYETSNNDTQEQMVTRVRADREVATSTPRSPYSAWRASGISARYLSFSWQR